ncbi:MAG TPA: Ldh family oxidoreductase [bacterium]|nr:Ldh family oxidoreductase [bacterium]
MVIEEIRVGFDKLKRFIRDVYEALGVCAEEAAICADVLVAADEQGIHSHGVNRLKRIYYDRIRTGIQNPVTRFDVIRDRPTTAVVDGHNGMGQVIAKKSMDLAISKARSHGMGMVAVRNSTHYGIAGYYLKMACDAEMIGITGTNARPSVAPTFGVENLLGTNPLCFGLPTDDGFPFLLDCATSIGQRGKIEAYAKLGKPIPTGWVIGSDGRPRTDASRILEEFSKGMCSLVPLGGIGDENGGHKGYGFATVVEILSAALQKGNYLKMLSGLRDGKLVPYRLGHFFIAIDVSAFIEPETFRKTAGEILRTLRQSKKMEREERIYTAGEKEYLYWCRNREKGCPLNRKVQHELKEIASELGMVERLPF